MARADQCPLCGEEIDLEAHDRMCALCRMLLPADRTFFVLYEPGRFSTFCSAACVRNAVLIAKSS